MTSEYAPIEPERSPIAKLDTQDRVIFEGQFLMPKRVDKDKWVFVYENNPARELSMTHAEIERRLDTKKLEVKDRFHSAENQTLIRLYGTDHLEDLESEEDREVALFRQKLICKWETTKNPETGKCFNRTEAELVPHLNKWVGDLNKSLPKKGRAKKSYASMSASRFSELYREYEKYGRNPIALAPRYDNSGPRRAKLDPDSIGFAVRHIRENYMTRLHKNRNTAYLLYPEDVEKENEGRDQKLVVLSQGKYNEIIKGMDQFALEASRFGPKAAIDKFGPNLGLTMTVRPGQRVEMDFWTTDIQTLFREGDAWDILPEKFRKAFETVRLEMCVAICTTTRCILGLNSSVNPNSATALSTARLMMTDKRHIGLQVGAKTPWIYRVVPEELVTDNGSPFLAEQFSSGLSSLGIKFTKPEAGEPRGRAFIESLFWTFGKELVSYFDGRTFPIGKVDDYKPEEYASLAATEFVKVMMLWILDVYHRRYHSGLGTSPHAAWQTAIGNWEIRYHLSETESLRAFGTLATKPRKINDYGIVWQGIPYENERLATMRLTSESEAFPIKFDRENVSTILVLGPEGWFPVQNRIGLDNTVILDEWIEARKEVQAQGKAHVEDGVPAMINAMTRLRNVGEAARLRMKLSAQHTTPEEYEKLEQDVFRGWVAQPVAEPPALTRSFARKRDPLLDGRVAEKPELVPVMTALPAPLHVDAPEEEESGLDYPGGP